MKMAAYLSWQAPERYASPQPPVAGVARCPMNPARLPSPHAAPATTLSVDAAKASEVHGSCQPDAAAWPFCVLGVARPLRRLHASYGTKIHRGHQPGSPLRAGWDLGQHRRPPNPEYRRRLTQDPAPILLRPVCGIEGPGSPRPGLEAAQAAAPPLAIPERRCAARRVLLGDPPTGPFPSP
jgi:hypothetical protein